MNPPLLSPALPQPTPLRKAAEAMETAFLSQLLQDAGLGRSPAAWGGGVGEDQFASLLVHEQARAIVAAGGIGLAESIHAALVRRGADD